MSIAVNEEASPAALSPELGMRVKKRNGATEHVDVNRIVYAVQRCAVGLNEVEPLKVALKTMTGLYDGATTTELDQLSIQTAADLITEDPQYSKLAARLLATFVDKEVINQGIHTFSDGIDFGHRQGLINDATAELVRSYAGAFNAAIRPERNELFEYFGLRTVVDRYLFKDRESRLVIETPQYFLMRVAAGLSRTPNEAIEFYQLISSLAYLPSTPTLFNSGGSHTQMSSCYLLDSPFDSLEGIYKRYTDVAKLSKFAGGIGVSMSRIRSRGAHIRGTNGISNGIVNWIKVLDSSVAAVNQGGRRKGAACVYLETWHADVLEFLELRNNTGDESRRTHNLNLANWVPDLFMKRVMAGEDWSLFDPSVVPELVDLYGDEFEAAYLEAEAAGKAVDSIPATELYSKMMRTLAQTGNGWMCFKDAANNKSNQTGKPGNVIHLSNLCTEIVEVTTTESSTDPNAAEQAVCNLGSINLGAHVTQTATGELHFDFEALARTARTAVRYLDRVIDINFYPTTESQRSNDKWRPVGLGVMGLQDAFFKLRLPFNSEEAKALSTRISEEIYFHALSASVDLAREFGPHKAFQETRAAQGVFQFELWDIAPTDPERWELLREDMKTFGLRNSLLVAIAPTATIASIAGAYECVEPQVSNVFKRQTLSGEFLQINSYLVQDLKAHGLWTESVRQQIKKANGSIQAIEEIPAGIRSLYPTAWELPMKDVIDMAADRGAFIDQSASTNLFVETPTIDKLSSMYGYAWERGLKTTYYLRSRPASGIAKTTTRTVVDETVPTPTPELPPMSGVTVSQSDASPGPSPSSTLWGEKKVVSDVVSPVPAHATQSDVVAPAPPLAISIAPTVESAPKPVPVGASWNVGAVAPLSTEVIVPDESTLSLTESESSIDEAKLACSLENPESCEMCQ